MFDRVLDYGGMINPLLLMEELEAAGIQADVSVDPDNNITHIAVKNAVTDGEIDALVAAHNAAGQSQKEVQVQALEALAGKLRGTTRSDVMGGLPGLDEVVADILEYLQLKGMV